MPSDVNLGVRSPKGLLPLRGSKLQLRFPVAHDHAVINCLATFLCHYKSQTGCQSFADGSGGPFQGLPACGAHDHPSGPPRSPRNSCRLAKHFHSRARLCRLLVGLRPPTPHRSLRSLRRRGFAHYVRLRHYRSSLFCYRKIIPSHSFAALTALVVRRVKGCITCRVPQKRRFSLRTPPEGALAGAPGSGTLPPCSLIL